MTATPILFYTVFYIFFFFSFIHLSCCARSSAIHNKSNMTLYVRIGMAFMYEMWAATASQQQQQ